MSAAPVSTLHEIGLLIAAETEIERALERVLRATQEQLGAASASVLLWDRQTGRGRRFTALTADEPGWEEGDETVHPGGLTETVLRDGRAVATEDAAADPPAPTGLGGRSGAVLAGPLRCDDDVLGVLYANFDRPRRFDARARRLIEILGGYAATAVRNSRLIEAARLDGAIKTAQAAAHELSQPLAVVVGYAELIQDCVEPEDVRRYASLVNRAALDAAARLDKFRNVVRFVELQFGDLDPILDLDRSAATD
ncbi:MAG TPA: GAF domain-containing protein [Chloroflexota bacterium]|nr:GAF domain-containing protein [Chloroflexota bacterium]